MTERRQTGSDEARVRRAALLLLLSLLPASFYSPSRADEPTSAEDGRSAADDANSSPTAATLEKPAQEILLARYGIEPTVESLNAYLAALHPDSETRRQTTELIHRLSEPQFSARERAMLELLRMPLPDVAQLQQAMASGDAETRWRAKVVVEDVDQRRDTILYAVCKTIARRKLVGLGEAVLSAIPLLEEPYLLAEARAALAATCTTENVPLLCRRIASDDARVRIAALSALTAVGEVASKASATSGNLAEGERRPAGATEIDIAAIAVGLLDDPDDQVRVAAAVALANLGRRESLTALAALLGSERLDVRVEAARSLRALTGQTIPFTAYDSAERRRKQQDAWRRWIETEGTAARLAYPLRRVAYEMGRTLVCNHGDSKLYEYDVSHKLVWEKAVGPQPWCCLGLPNGHRLVALYNSQHVVEYDAAGKEVWTAGGLPGGPTSLERLDNGNTLIACTDSQKVVEVDPQGKIVWNVTVEGRPVKAQRLDNGRTLVVLQNAGRVVEIDRRGTIIWELTGAESPFSAQRLDNGNTLVCMMNSGEVHEYDSHKRKVWSHSGLHNPYDVQRTAAGTTLIVDNSGVVEVDRRNQVVWRLSMPNVSRAHRF